MQEHGQAGATTSPARRILLMFYLGACAALAVYLCFFVRGVDPDYYWHLRSGEVMLLNRTRFNSDIFSWTFQDQPWLDHEWLAQLAYALADRLGGYGGVRVLHGLLVFAYLGILWRILRLGGMHGASALGLALVAGLGTYAIFLPRPQTVSVLGVTIFTWALFRAQLEPERNYQFRWLPLLIIPWANCHAGFMMGLAWLLMAALGEALQRQRPLAPGPALSTRELLLLAGAGAVAGLATPHGPALYVLAFRSIFDRDLRWMNTAVGEWRPPGLYETPHLLLLAYAALVLCAVWHSHRLLWTPLIWSLVACATASLSIRHLPFAWIALTVMASLNLPAALRDWLASPGKAAALGGWCLTVVALAALEIVGGWAPAYPSNQALARLQRLPGEYHLFNAYDWGGIFIYFLYPRQLVYIDGRLWTLYDARHLQAYYRLAEARPGWQELLLRQDIDLIAVPPEAPIAQAVAQLPRWQTIFHDRTAVILIRKDRVEQAKASPPAANKPGAP